MTGVALVSFCCLMFIHLGLGEALNRETRLDFILFRCVKCLNFWSVLCYTLFVVKLPFVESSATAFATTYAVVWIDLIMAKIARKYDIWYNQTEEDNDSTQTGNSRKGGNQKKRKKKEGIDDRMP